MAAPASGREHDVVAEIADGTAAITAFGAPPGCAG